MRISIIIVPLAVIVGVSTWYWNYSHPEPVSVTVTSVEKGTVEATVANTRAGTIKACRRAKLSPSLGGQISELPFSEGDLVKAGTVLLRVWNQDLQAEISHSKQSIQAAEDVAKASCLQAQIARRTEQRSRRLKEEASISQDAYDKANTEAQVRAADCKAAKANVAVARARVKVAEAQLNRTILLAPFNGVIAKINGELNEYVTPSPPGIQTPPVIDLIEPDCFYVNVPIDEVDAPKVKLGMFARISLDAWRDRVFEAEVSRIGSYVVDREKQARTVDIELAFKNPADLDALLVGYSADADIVLETHEDVLRIPSEALADDTHVFIYNSATGLLVKKTVKKGLSNWSFTEILDGLAVGDKLVMSPGAAGVADGVLAKVTEDNAAQPES